MSLRNHWPLAVLVVLALALRLWSLDAIPNPSGDEGNWTWFAYDLLKGRPVQLPPDARFVSLAFARLIAVSFALSGPSFASARMVCVVGVVVAMVVAYLACSAMGARRAAMVIALFLAVHPWSVLWSRTVSVPYAMALATGTAGPLALVAALRARRRVVRSVGLVASAQLLFLGVHFSPLALIALVACAGWMLVCAQHRRVLRTPAPWVALGLGLLHVVPVLRDAMTVAERGTTRPSHWFEQFGLRLYTYVRTVLGGLSGEATLRHFTGGDLPLPWEIVVTVVLVCVVVAVGWGGDRSCAVPEGELRSFGWWYFGLSLVGLPVLLAPARTWNLPAIDAERYLFTVLAPFFIVMGAAAERGRRRWLTTLGIAGYLLFGPTARAAHAFIAGGGPDSGAYLLLGGRGYRGWKVTRERRAVPWLIQQEVDRVARRTPATILVADYAFHPVHFANVETPYPTVDIAKFPMPSRPGERFFFVLWSDGLLAPGFSPSWVVEWNRRLRREMHQKFEQVRLVRRFVQPDGSPLFELWTGIQR